MMFTIDPGISGTGWALWDDEGKLKFSGVITPPARFKWEDKCQIVIKQLMTKWRGAREVYVEFPAMMGGGRGVVTASSGALVKLTILVGMIMNEFSAKPITVASWKGQLPKEIVEKRVKELLPKCKAKSHAIDAIGIGLYIQGRF